MDRRQTFGDFFASATRFRPYPYQVRLAEAETWPAVIEAPTGAGKTAAVVLSWAWRSLPDLGTNAAVRDGNQPPRSGIPSRPPRRLVYCLPMRVLVEQTYRNAVTWLHRLGLLAGRAEFDEDGRLVGYDPYAEGFRSDRISVHLLMGGDLDRDWDRYPEGRAILVGTQDMLLSRALNRGYAMSRFRWPLQFGLLNNDVLWVFDEVQLMGVGLTTSCQMQAFRRHFSTILPAQSTWMSATIRREWLATVDMDPDRDATEWLGLTAGDRSAPGLSDRLTAGKRVERKTFLGWGGSKDEKKAVDRDLAGWVAQIHRPGALTLIVLNQVSRAQRLFDGLEAIKKARKSGASLDGLSLQADVLLLHSRFRPADRAVILDRLLSDPGPDGLIAVATQVVEAGVDVSAKTLVTDLAPWPSMVQRFGRCNRAGEYDDAAIYWLDPGEQGLDQTAALPYDPEQLLVARGHLTTLDDAKVEALPPVELPFQHSHVIRKKDLLSLFDTTPDLAGADLDVSGYVRSADETSAQVFWRSIPKDRKIEGQPAPTREELCPVPMSELRKWVKKNSAWRWDHVEGRWQLVHANGLVAGMVVMLDAAEGGYSSDRGWTGKKVKKGGVTVIGHTGTDQESLSSDPLSSFSQGQWQTIAEHTDAVVEHVGLLARDLALDPDKRDLLLEAARWHDAGKAHPVFQEAFAAAQPPRSDTWAKAAGRVARYSRPGFRHELASALAVLGLGKDDLVAYLVAAHHGKVRMSIRSLPGEKVPDDGRRFARGIWDGDSLGPAELGAGQTLPAVSLDLSVMELGHGPQGPSWSAKSLALLERLGPFRLAMLEAFLRVADWRGSSQQEDGDEQEVTR